MKTIKNQIMWGIFLIVPVVFILSTILPDIVNVVLLPVGCVAAVIVLVIDLFCKKIFAKEQIFKMFCYSLLLIKVGQLYECETVINIAAVVAVGSVLAIVIWLPIKLDDVSEQARKIDKM